MIYMTIVILVCSYTGSMQFFAGLFAWTGDADL